LPSRALAPILGRCAGSRRRRSAPPPDRASRKRLAGRRAPDDLAGHICKALLDDLDGLGPAEIDDIICGAALQAGEQSMNLGKVVAALAGLPASVPGMTVNRFCASSLQAIRIAAHAIAAGEADACLAVGVESVSRADGGFDPGAHGNPRFTDPGRGDYVNDMYIAMGQTAENVADRWGVSRERMDELSALSQKRAVAARDGGFFAREIAPVAMAGEVVDTDDSPRPGTTVERLAELEPAFRPEGRVTAGNSCSLNDGAAAVLVMSDRRAAQLGLQPRLRVVSSAVSSVAPEIMGVGPIEAIRTALDRAGMTIGDVDVVELNEAFAAQVLPICDDVGINVEEQLNPHGGAIALGHPFGMTGARMMCTLLNDLETLDGSVGLEAMCAAGGQVIAMVAERGA
jgi:acetyl-CoA C-acetyltransferase